MKDFIVYYRIGAGNHYASIFADRKIGDILEINNCETREIRSIVDKKSIIALGFPEPQRDGGYKLIVNEELIAYERQEQSILLNKSLYLKEFESRVISVVKSFKSTLQNNLVSKIYSAENSIKDVLNQLLEYSFTHHYSLWLYNSHTQHYHLHCSSFDTSKNFISASDNNCTFGDIHNSNSNHISRSIHDDKINSICLKEMRWLNRFLIKTDSEHVGIASFYSKYENYFLSKHAIAIIPEIIKASLITESSHYLEKHQKIRCLWDQYSPGNFLNFLNTAISELTTRIGWESISVFLSDQERPEILKLTALALNGKSIPLEYAEYDTTTPSLTASVFNSSKLAFSYDIQNDPRNSHVFDEPSETPPQNWLGLPISRFPESPVGVLRALNKKDRNGQTTIFNAFDIEILKNIASVIAYIFRIEISFRQREEQIQRDLINQEEENKQLNEFLKTFRHELKSPLTIVTQASNTIKRSLISNNFCGEDNMPRKIVDVLSDLDMVGSRLVFVTSVLTFDAQEMVKEFETAKFFQDIIAPVLAFSTEYAKRRKKNIKVDKSSLLYDVNCDPKAASMVFHMLLDNAIKYSNPGTTINVFGTTSKEYCFVTIESYGLAIMEDEKEYIFKKYYRGRQAEKQKTEGSGIGLYLGSEIMNINNGSLILKRISSPTSFVLSIKRAN
ncbi:GAF domain-containing sensor histidine kinase [Methylomonas sp. HW2-6]|uniref:GAF domain-containing sensor histidine kinase n=1 Tax=Methylomonas sp. HW2-6 TaxID=3376687 RepID=UPI0040420CCF